MEESLQPPRDLLIRASDQRTNVAGFQVPVPSDGREDLDVTSGQLEVAVTRSVAHRLRNEFAKPAGPQRLSGHGCGF